ncbi:hypothetical protein GCM10027567_16120 [Spongiibacter taiwanensis]
MRWEELISKGKAAVRGGDWRRRDAPERGGTVVLDHAGLAAVAKCGAESFAGTVYRNP